EFTYDTWRRNLTAGRTFVSGGPILWFSVEGAQAGDTVRLAGNGGTVEVVATAESVLPIHTLQIVQDGAVVAETGEAGGTRRLSIRTRLPVDRHSWLAARVGGPGYDRPLVHHDVWRRGIFAHTSPIYLACGEDWHMFDEATAEYMLTMLE